VAPTGRHLGAVTNISSEPIACEYTDVPGTPSGA
jgi:hypothetical protein